MGFMCFNRNCSYYCKNECKNSISKAARFVQYTKKWEEKVMKNAIVRKEIEGYNGRNKLEVEKENGKME